MNPESSQSHMERLLATSEDDSEGPPSRDAQAGGPQLNVGSESDYSLILPDGSVSVYPSPVPIVAAVTDSSGTSAARQRKGKKRYRSRSHASSGRDSGCCACLSAWWRRLGGKRRQAPTPEQATHYPIVTLIVVSALALCCSGTMYGWPSLHVVLLNNHVYSSQCSQADLIKEGTCDEQSSALNLVFTVSNFVCVVTFLLWGFFVDHYGARYGIAAGGTLFLLGCGLFSYSFYAGNEYALWAGALLLSTSGPCIWLGCVLIASNFPGYEPAILSLMSCLYDSSTTIFQVFEVIPPCVDTYQLFAGFGLLVAVLMVVSLIRWPPSPTSSGARARARARLSDASSSNQVSASSSSVDTTAPASSLSTGNTSSAAAQNSRDYRPLSDHDSEDLSRPINTDNDVGLGTLSPPPAPPTSLASLSLSVAVTSPPSPIVLGGTDGSIAHPPPTPHYLAGLHPPHPASITHFRADITRQMRSISSVSGHDAEPNQLQDADAVDYIAYDAGEDDESEWEPETPVALSPPSMGSAPTSPLLSISPLSPVAPLGRSDRLRRKLADNPAATSIDDQGIATSKSRVRRKAHSIEDVTGGAELLRRPSSYQDASTLPARSGASINAPSLIGDPQSDLDSVSIKTALLTPLSEGPRMVDTEAGRRTRAVSRVGRDKERERSRARSASAGPASSVIMSSVFGRTFRQQVCSKEYLSCLLFMSLSMFRLTFYFGTVNDQLWQISTQDQSNHYVRILGFILPTSFLFVPLIGYILDRKSLTFAFMLVTINGVIVAVLSTINILELQIVTFVFFTIYRASLYSAFAAYLAVVFGYANFGKLTGLASIVGGGLGVSQFPLLSLAFHLNSFVWINTALVGFSVISFFFPFYIHRISLVDSSFPRTAGSVNARPGNEGNF